MLGLSLLPIANEDLPFVRSMLFEAAFWRGSIDAPSLEDALRQPDLARYIVNWGRPGDQGLVARIASERVGAVWLRLFDEDDHGYGFVDISTPELSIAVVRRYRRSGIGRQLLDAALGLAAAGDHGQVSLSVEEDNPALRLYAEVGFVPLTRAGGAVTMVRTVR